MTVSSRKGYVGDLLAFLIAATLWIKIHAVGELLGSDLVVVLALPVVLSMRLGRLRSHFSAQFLKLSLVSLISLAASDLWRGTPVDDLLRGWSRNGLFLVSFIVLFPLLRGRPARIVYFSLGLVAQGYLAYFVTPSAYSIAAPWKFGLAMPTTLLIILSGLYLDRHLGSLFWSRSACVFAGLINIALNFRSLGGVCLVAAMLLYLSNGGGLHLLGRRVPKWVMAVLLLGGIVGLSQLYTGLASSGSLGKAARDKYETQGTGRYGIIGGGRSEFFGSFLAIRDSPILGHGSWARDPIYRLEAMMLRRAAGYKDQPSGPSPDDDLIPSHSHLFGAWVEGGIFAALLWAWVWYRAARSLLVVASSPQLCALRTFLCLSLMWDILFSPAGGAARYTTVFNLIVVCAPEIFATMPRRVGHIALQAPKMQTLQRIASLR